MEVFIVVIIIAIFAIAVPIGLKARNEQNQLIAQGRMLKRDAYFMECTETFTLSGGEYNRVLEAIKAANLSGTGVSVSSNASQQSFAFQASGWAAQMYRAKDDGDQFVYCFGFTKWKTRKGIPLDYVPMNLLLTAVEKAFLSIDPQTKVQSSKAKLKTRPSFF